MYHFHILTLHIFHNHLCSFHVSCTILNANIFAWSTGPKGHHYVQYYHQIMAELTNRAIFPRNVCLFKICYIEAHFYQEKLVVDDKHKNMNCKPDVILNSFIIMPNFLRLFPLFLAKTGLYIRWCVSHKYVKHWQPASVSHLSFFTVSSPQTDENEPMAAFVKRS